MFGRASCSLHECHVSYCVGFSKGYSLLMLKLLDPCGGSLSCASQKFKASGVSLNLKRDEFVCCFPPPAPLPPSLSLSVLDEEEWS